jgi:hypothetical protein
MRDMKVNTFCAVPPEPEPTPAGAVPQNQIQVAASRGSTIVGACFI